MSSPTYLVTAPSTFGAISLVWLETLGNPLVLRIFLSGEQHSSEELAAARYDHTTHHTHPIIDDLVDQLQRILRGQDIRPPLDLMAMPACSDFQERVLRTEYEVPRGWTTTYGRIARHLGSPRAARAVGAALARNPFPLVIPCHRAIRSDGHLGGYQGGRAMKRELLAMEGVEISKSGIVLSSRRYY